MEWEQGKASPVLIAETTLNVDLTHSERLLWGIDQILEASRWKLEEVDVFGVGVGPGSFTGLRVGITTARTLSHTLKKPLVGVSSLAALARPVALSLQKPTLVIATTDACKGELFALWGTARGVADCAAMAQGDVPGLWKRGVEEQVLSPDRLMKAIERKKLPWIAVGEGHNRYPEEWKKLPARSKLESPIPFSDQIQGRYVGLLSWEAHQVGLAREGLKIHPRYVRAPDAELKLKATRK